MDDVCHASHWSGLLMESHQREDIRGAWYISPTRKLMLVLHSGLWLWLTRSFTNAK